MDPVLQRVRLWAGPKVDVAPWNESLPGAVRVFVLRDGGVRGVAMRPDDEVPLEGARALRAVLDAAGRRDIDPAALARLSVLLVDQPGAVVEPLADPGVVAALRSDLGDVDTPRIEDQTLVYWRLHAQPFGVARVGLDLITCSAEVELVTRLDASAEETQLRRLRRALVDLRTEVALHALDELHGCRPLGAVGLLGEVAQTHPEPAVRARAAAVLGSCADEAQHYAAAAFLGPVLRADLDVAVRIAAVHAVGSLSGVGHDLLLHATLDPDDDVRAVARACLRRRGDAARHAPNDDGRP